MDKKKFSPSQISKQEKMLDKQEEMLSLPCHKSIFSILSVVYLNGAQYSNLHVCIANTLAEAMTLAKANVVKKKGSYDQIEHPMYAKFPINDIFQELQLTEEKRSSKIMQMIIDTSDNELLEKLKLFFAKYEIKYINDKIKNKV